MTVGLLSVACPPGTTGGTGGTGGWTNFVQTTGAIIYVSTTDGHDNNNGLSSTPNPTNTGGAGAAGPKKTLSAGSALLTNGQPDWMLLKCGDIFTNQQLSRANLAGASMTVAPAWNVAGDHTVSGMMLFGYYGNQSAGRPLVQISAAVMGGSQSWLKINGANSLNHVAWNGWDFYAYTRDPNNVGYVSADATYSCGCIDSNSSGQNVLFEDCKFSFFGGSFSMSPASYDVQTISTLIFRRNMVKYNYLSGNEAQGMYLSGISTFCLIEDNLWDFNGWLPAAWGVPNTGANSRNHNAYFSCNNTGNFIIRGNIFANDVGMSEFRAGGVIYNNLFVSTGATMGAGMGPVTMTYNVIQDSGAYLGNGYGFELYDAIGGSLVDHNIVSNENALGVSATNDFFVLVHGPDDGEWGTWNVGSFVAGSPVISNVHTITSGNEDANTMQNWNVGIGLAGPSVPASTTVLSRSFSGGTAGTITMSKNATSTATGAVLTKANLNQTVSNNICWKHWDNANPGLVQHIRDGGVNTTITNNCYDPNGTNSGQPGEPFPSPNRSVPTYSTSLGGAGTIADFLTNSVMQKSNWNAAYTAAAFNDYMRAGFNQPLQGSGSTFDAATTAWVNAVTAAGGAVSVNTKGAVDAFIVGCKSDGNWAGFDRCWLLAGDDITGALIDLVGNAVATNHGSVLTPHAGCAGNGTTTYIDTGAIPSAMTKFTLNSGSLFTYVKTNVLPAGDCTFAGVQDPGGLNVTKIGVHQTTFLSCAINSQNYFPNAATSVGTLIATRTAAGQQAAYQNGSLIASDTANASTARSTLPIYVGGINASGLAAPTSAPVSLVGIGAGLDAAHALSLSQRIATLVSAL